MEDVLNLEMEKSERQRRILQCLHLDEMEYVRGTEEETEMAKQDTRSNKNRSIKSGNTAARSTKHSQTAGKYSSRIDKTDSRTSSRKKNVSAAASRASAEKNSASATVSRVSTAKNNASATVSRVSTAKNNASATMRRTSAEKNNTSATVRRTSAEKNNASATMRRTSTAKNNASATMRRTSAEKSNTSATVRRTSSEKRNASATASRASSGKRNKSTRQAVTPRRSSKRKKRTASPTRQCAVFGILTLLIAGAAILHEANGSIFTESWSENRIRTAWDQMTGSDEAEKSTETAGDGTDWSNGISDEGTDLNTDVAGMGSRQIDGNDAAGSVETDSAFNPLILVNKEYALPENYEVQLHQLNNGREAVAEQMYDALSAMLTDGSTDGRVFVVASGYRSYERQQELLEEDIQSSMEKYNLTWQEAYDRESKETMPEGHSEHETGLAVDLVALDYQMLDAAQEYTEENQWLQEHCQEYGFILRYPRGKEDITGISYESWHFRYVGEEAAREITERGLTLEEYLGVV